MTPIKLAKFLTDMAPQVVEEITIDLNQLGLFHAAPKEDGQRFLALRFDTASGTLIPAG